MYLVLNLWLLVLWTGESKDMLIWEIKSLKGLEWSCLQEIQFHHPALKLSVSGGLGGNQTPNTMGGIVELDGNVDTNEDKVRQLLDMPIEEFTFRGYRQTRAIYEGKELAALVRSWKAKPCLEMGPYLVYAMMSLGGYCSG